MQPWENALAGERSRWSAETGGSTVEELDVEGGGVGERRKRNRERTCGGISRGLGVGVVVGPGDGEGLSEVVGEKDCGRVALGMVKGVGRDVKGDGVGGSGGRGGGE